MPRLTAPLFCAAAFLAVAGCSKPDASSGGAASAAPSGSAASAPATTAAKPADPAAAVGEMVEIDLSSADPVWKGWVAKGPKDAKVLADGVHGARIAANGMNAFDVAFAPAKTSLKDVKSGAEAAMKGSGGKLTVTFTVDTADKLEWKSDGYGTTTYNFVWNYKASGKDVSCLTNAAMGANSEAQLKQFKDACGTLTKK
jgi:hypothetical protein